MAFVVVTQLHLKAWLPADTGWFQPGQENSSNDREPKEQVK
jgi:hypothetical protein